MHIPLDPGPVMATLKDFQRKTIEYVFGRMYKDKDYASRFLVADEVGLGKTLVAQGLIAKAISHLQSNGYERIDIVYVCSNASIAQQNVKAAGAGYGGIQRSDQNDPLATVHARVVATWNQPRVADSRHVI